MDAIVIRNWFSLRIWRGLSQIFAVNLALKWELINEERDKIEIGFNGERDKTDL